MRIASHKLQQPIFVENLTPETVVRDVKAQIQAHFAQNKTYLAPETAEEDERTGTMAYQLGDQLVLYAGATVPKGAKGVLSVKRCSNGAVGLVNDTSVMELQLKPEEQMLYFGGEQLGDDDTLGQHELINSERLFLDFRWPWAPSEEEEKAAAAKGGAKKK